MKTFKHKKTGEIAEEYPDYYRTRYWQTVTDIPKRLIEDSSDWEEIIHKKWEILSFVNEDNRLTYKVVSGECRCYMDGFFHNIGTRTIDYCTKFYKINSVKRLSDGVIFTLNEVLEGITIKGIIIRTNGKQCWLQSDLKNPDYGCCLSVGKKVEYLHTTKDGYKINTGDKYFIVDNFRIREVVGGTFLKSRWDGFRFKDRENAEDWIIGNKPCLSLNDVTKVIVTYISDFENLKNLIKTRI